MSWSKKRGPNMQAPDLKREHRASVLLSPGRSANLGHQRKLGSLTRRSRQHTDIALLRSASAGVVGVGVLQLELVGMPIQHNVGIEGLTLVANRLAEISYLSTLHQQGVIRKPGIQIRIRDGLNQLMGEHGVR